MSGRQQANSFHQEETGLQISECSLGPLMAGLPRTPGSRLTRSVQGNQEEEGEAAQKRTPKLEGNQKQALGLELPLRHKATIREQKCIRPLNQTPATRGKLWTIEVSGGLSGVPEFS